MIVKKSEAEEEEEGRRKGEGGARRGSFLCLCLQWELFFSCGRASCYSSGVLVGPCGIGMYFSGFAKMLLS